MWVFCCWCCLCCVGFGLLMVIGSGCLYRLCELLLLGDWVCLICWWCMWCWYWLVCVVLLCFLLLLLWWFLGLESVWGGLWILWGCCCIWCWVLCSWILVCCMGDVIVCLLVLLSCVWLWWLWWCLWLIVCSGCWWWWLDDYWWLWCEWGRICLCWFYVVCCVGWYVCFIWLKERKLVYVGCCGVCNGKLCVGWMCWWLVVIFGGIGIGCWLNGGGIVFFVLGWCVVWGGVIGLEFIVDLGMYIGIVDWCEWCCVVY